MSRPWRPDEPRVPMTTRGPVYVRREDDQGGESFEEYGYVYLSCDPTGDMVWVPEEVGEKVAKLIREALDKRNERRVTSKTTE